ncbi:DUF2946 family protein [Dechloromonas sp. HYN0024]|uniref:DUF2946 family protein n=1 Tax=Dechloromonas sp. HYN0024 TaxID=2231055 RepID=UPI000E42EC0A|nr:DUF2946 family protein [Dechloromonas sp. HYN0024]AXS80047.1 DUF2946 family protein [Dechloromonas sp. HYN0024]
MAVDLSAIAKWPNVPACYDWLSLDRRGDWRLQGARVTHSGLIQFINRQYGCDKSGCWFLQNGPQRVFVALAYTPWIFRRDGEMFVSHTGEAAGAITAIHLDEEGSVLLETALGIGLLDDRDLPAWLDECRHDNDWPVSEENWLSLMSGCAANISWHGMPIRQLQGADVARRFNFQPTPRP